MAICWAALIFLVLTLPGALRRRHRVVNPPNSPEGVEASPTEKEDNRPYWQKNPSASVLARDRLEVLEMWGRNHDDPMNSPAPIPPAKPHPYFGDESGKDNID